MMNGFGEGVTVSIELIETNIDRFLCSRLITQITHAKTGCALGKPSPPRHLETVGCQQTEAVIHRRTRAGEKHHEPLNPPEIPNRLEIPRITHDSGIRAIGMAIHRRLPGPKFVVKREVEVHTGDGLHLPSITKTEPAPVDRFESTNM